MNKLPLLTLSLALVAGFTSVSAAEASAPPSSKPAAVAPKSSALKPVWVFSLLPKSFQKNPFLEMTIFTEMTEAGKKLTPPDAQHPAYYSQADLGYHQFGDPTKENPPPIEAVNQGLLQALAGGGYLRSAGPEQPPSILLVLHWGSHNKLDADRTAENPDQALRDVITRARLVGGDAFAQRLLKACIEDSRSSQGAEGRIGFSKVYLLAQESETLRFLIDQANEDIYYVAASAYDYAAASRGQHVLLWRTTMSASTKGVSMQQTLPPLIASATPYFGHETLEAVPIIKRGTPDGKVEIGETKLIKVEEKSPPATK